MRRSTAIRAAACTVLAAGLAAPLLRRRLRLKPPVVIDRRGGDARSPSCVLVPRSRARDVGMCVLQMCAYVATYKMPNDDPEALEARVRVDYPVRVDQRRSGCGTTPTLRLQRALGTPGALRALGEGAGVVALAVVRVPARHASPYVLLRHRERFPARRRADLRDVRHRRDRLLGDPDRAAVVRRPARA